MASLSARYQAGDWNGVWHEIRTTASSELVAADVDDVASATMQRARRQIDDLAWRFVDLGLRSAGGVPVRTLPPPDVVERLAVVERTTGHLPAALRAVMTHVGGVRLMGDLPRLRLSYTAGKRPRTMPPGPPYADPLVIPDIDYLEYETREHLDEAALDASAPLLPFGFAPDELHKANISGGEHTISFSTHLPDPVLTGVAGRPGITLVEYLRLSIAWGGLPGYSFAPRAAPTALARLRADPAF